MSQTDQAAPASLTRANRRRQALHEAMAGLEAAAAAPTGAARWLDKVEEALAAVRSGLEAHIEEVEGPDGILAEIASLAPRLTSATRQLASEHAPLLLALYRTERAVQSARDDEGSDGDAVRRRVTTLLGRVTLHRQHGSDLVYEAYNVDIEAGD